MFVEPLGIVSELPAAKFSPPYHTAPLLSLVNASPANQSAGAIAPRMLSVIRMRPGELSMTLLVLARNWL